MTKRCFFCKKIFTYTLQRFRRFCSSKCRSASWPILHPIIAKRQRQKYFKRIKKENPILCKRCKTVVKNRKPGKFYCSKACVTITRLENNRQTRKRLQKKFSQWKEKQGCFRCGYNSFGGALDFDHIDPKTKSRRILATDWKHRYKRPLILAELKKCQLLCSNCHREKTWKEDRRS